ncbi:MAG: thioredoxin domain-containing protein, partial [Alphaproteobacteria bacterium]|nr:thioredoxin domain-containing protein [Alphaproteobacteria bacterium]
MRMFPAVIIGLILFGFAARADDYGVDAPHEHLSSVSDPVFDQKIRDYILAHPEIIVEALREAKKQELASRSEAARETLKSHRRELLDDPASPIAGNPRGDVTIVEFFDYRCPFCKRVEPALKALLKEDA